MAISKAGKIAKRFRREMVVLITAAFGFVAALFWQTAIRDAINAFVPASTGWQWEILAAVIVSVIAVAAILSLSRFSEE